MAKLRHFFIIMMLMVVVMTGNSVVWAATAPPASVARAAELVDAATGKVLFQQNANAELPMASVTKLMTLYIAVKAVVQHKVSLSSLVPADEDAYHIGGSQIWLRPGERLTVDQMLKAIAVGSANDAAYALGAYLGGSETQFVAIMNQTARQLGMMHTHFVNPHGLPARDHFTTAHDLAILGSAAVKYPLLLHYTSQWQDRTIRNGKGGSLWLINQNRLLRTYIGADGLKTGYTHAAGFCMVATARREGTRLIAVILGAPTSKLRFADAQALMTWGFLNYRTFKLATPSNLPKTLPVAHGAISSVMVALKRPVMMTVPTADWGHVSWRIETVPRLIAPVALQQEVGSVTVVVPNQPPLRIPIVATQSVRRVGFGELVWNYFWYIAQ
ncbi:MAG: D-alanyl-D-alanine carboxypeptidase family protein [Sulfobacillus sp.]